MAILAGALVLLAVVGPTRSIQDDAWAATWAQLARLEASDPASADADALATELERSTRIDGVDEMRSTLLRARLERFRGRDTTEIGRALGRFSLTSYSPHECWLLAEVVAGRDARARTVLRGLHTTRDLSREQQVFAWKTAVDSARALRLADNALPIFRILHERYVAAWSAIDLTLTLSRLGDVEGVAKVMSETIAREEAAGRPSADLWSTWGNATLGFGDESTARDYFGQALARGSTNAALVLGRLELLAGEWGAARRSFRPSIMLDDPAAWAARGWGLTLLPASRDAASIDVAERGQP